METPELIAHLIIHGFQVKKYSGRGMNGRYCVGFIADALDNYLYDLFRLIAYEKDAETRQNLCETMEDIQTDKLGHDTIVYFPASRWTDNSESDGKLIPDSESD